MTDVLRDTLKEMIAEVRRLDPGSFLADMADEILAKAPDDPFTAGYGGIGRPAFRFTPMEEADIVRRYKEGASTHRLAGEFDCGVTSIAAVLKRRGAKVRGAHEGHRFGSKARGDARVDEIKEMLSLGKNMSEIGTKLGISRERVRQICLRNKIDTTRQLTPEQKAAVAEYVGGESLAYVAAKYNSNLATLRKWVLYAGETLRPSNRRVHAETKARAKKAVELYHRGLTGEEIAKELGINAAPTIYRLLAMEGIKPNRRPGAGSSAKKQKVIDLYRSGMSVRDIADELDYAGPGPIYRWLAQEGIELRG